MNVATKKIAGNVDYAGVADRLKRFREDNPRARITTEFKELESGGFIFQSTILKDKADADSAEATGTAMYSAKEMEKQKAFEKLETIAVGRALSLMGYLNNGEIASSEEMEEFEGFKDNKQREEAEKKLNSSKTLSDLQTIYTEIFKSNPTLGRELTALKDELKVKLGVKHEDTANTAA